MKKIKILASIDEEMTEGDRITFSVQKSKNMSLLEILGLLRVITDEVRQNLKNKIKVVKDG